MHLKIISVFIYNQLSKAHRKNILICKLYKYLYNFKVSLVYLLCIYKKKLDVLAGEQCRGVYCTVDPIILTLTSYIFNT